ncbi:CoA transferase [Limnohabitans sp.]|uniref:CoA transferase n=1 Tax=Limnohabitans sp. TaxID=1907725 RepID=UPI0038B8AB42
MTLPTSASSKPAPVSPLKGVRILSLALNLPGPAALMRLRGMGAHCTKLEPLAPADTTTADPMGLYKPAAYEAMHQGVLVVQADLKTERGQARLHKLLTRTDVLITSFRPSALIKLGLGWRALHRQYPALCMVSVVGASGVRAEEPGHDLTYLAENGLVNGLDMPASLYADMGGSLLTTEAVLQALLMRQRSGRLFGRGVFQEIALSDAAAYLALPRSWGLTTPDGDVGGVHAGYRVYACKNGRVAVAALEPHFATRLCAAAGLPQGAAQQMHERSTHHALTTFFASQTRQQLDRLARSKDIPLHSLPR